MVKVGEYTSLINPIDMGSVFFFQKKTSRKKKIWKKNSAPFGFCSLDFSFFPPGCCSQERLVQVLLSVIPRFQFDEVVSHQREVAGVSQKCEISKCHKISPWSTRVV